MAWLRSFLLALQFLSIIQVRGRLEIRREDLPRSMIFYPLVGLILGMILVCVHWLCIRAWAPLIADLMAVLSAMMLTRALHLDGLADTLDGLLGSSVPERSLEIMKDSSLGSFGVAGIVAMVLLKFAALTGVPASFKLETLLLVPVLGRHSMVQLAFLSPYARAAGGLGKAFVDGLSLRHYLPAAASAVVCGFWIAGTWGLLLFAFLWVVTWLQSLLARWRVGGVTGDILGAGCEVNEVLALLFLAAWLG